MVIETLGFAVRILAIFSSQAAPSTVTSTPVAVPKRNSNLDANEIDLPIHVDTGAYVVRLDTNKGSVLKKVIIK